jgi:hypothetical protein
LEIRGFTNRIIADVSKESKRQQIPVVYGEFSGTAYLGNAPEKVRDATRLWTVGGSVGTSFADPWLIATVQGTLAPLRYSFLEIGMDVGFLSSAADTEYFSLYPFIHYALFLPFAPPSGKESSNIGWYAGAGGGYMFARYSFPKGEIWDNTWAIDFYTGFIFWNMLTVSYTLRTNFATVNQKAAVGFVKRF